MIGPGDVCRFDAFRVVDVRPFIHAHRRGWFKPVQCNCFCSDEDMKTVVPGTRRNEDGAP